MTDVKFIERCALKVAFVFMAVAVQNIDCSHRQHSNILPTINCTADTRVSLIEVTNPNQHFKIKLSSNFKYLQISMRIDSCYSHSIFRGNRFLTSRTLNISHTEMTILMDVSYRRIGGRHAYHVAIEDKEIRFSDDINTSEKCGKCRGFKVKAVGAAVCPLLEKNTQKTQTAPSKPSSDVSFPLEDGSLDTGNKLISSSSVNDDFPKEEDDVLWVRAKMPMGHNDEDFSRVIHNLHLWANGAYIVAICLSLSIYLMFLIAKECRKRMEYSILDNRDLSNVPENSP